eukprot:Nk52_evm4s221 gene=Nk52_evmTU4s221
MGINKFKAVARKMMASKVFTVWLLVGIYIFSRSFDRVLSRRWTTQMVAYDYMAGALIFPIGGFLASLLMLLGAWALGHVSREACMVNQWPYIIAAVFDGTNSILNSTAQSFIPAQLDQALSQLVIPFTMIVSYFALKRRYQAMHYLAAFMVLYGIALTIQPMFTGKGMVLTGADKKSYQVSVWFILLDIAAFFPSACSNTYKEYVLKGKNISVFWFSVVNVFYQTIWGTPDGPDQCNNVWEWFLLYIFFNLAFNITLLKISKEVSGAFAAVVSATVFILADFLFLSEDLAGTVQPLQVWTVFGMIAVAMGVIMYGSRSELDIEGNEIMKIQPVKQGEDHLEYEVSNIYSNAEEGNQKKM